MTECPKIFEGFAPMPATKKSQRPIVIRFVEKYSVDVSGCWLWMGATDTPGYGRFKWKGRIDGAHRVSWEMTFGEIPDNLFVLHRCNVKRCVNPAHLYLGDPSTNALDAVRDGLWTERNQQGERNAHARLTADDVRSIRERYARGGISQKQLGAEYATDYKYISEIVTRRAWASV